MIKKIIKKLKLKSVPNYQLAYLVVVLLFTRIISLQYDNDFWFTINQGRYIIEHSFPTVAINTIHNLSFLYQSWGTGTLFYLIYNYLGFYGMAFLLVLVSSLTMYFFYKLCFVVSNNKRASIICTIVATCLYSFYIVTRPHIFTVLNLVIMLYLLESYIKTNKSKYLYWLPLISLFEINMHGIYFILLLIILCPYLINAFKFKINFLKINSEGYRKKPLIIAFLCMLLTGFINPYGYRTIIYGFTSYNASGLFNNTIVELLALDFHNLTGKLFIITIVAIYVLHFSKLRERPLRYTLLLLGTSYLAFDAVKSFYLFLFCSLFPLSMIHQKKKDNIDETYSKAYHILHLSVTILLCLGMILLIEKPKFPETKKFIDYLDSVVEDKEKIKLYTNYNEGSYAEYRGYNCYIDPRGEIFLKSNNNNEDIYEEYDNLRKGQIDHREFLDKYNFDYILASKDELLYILMNRFDLHGYKIVLSDDNYVLLSKEG